MGASRELPPQHPAAINAIVKVGRDLLATACSDGLLRFLRISTGEQVSSVAAGGRSEELASLCFVPGTGSVNDVRLASAGWDKQLRLWALWPVPTRKRAQLQVKSARS